jgi:hypothetical protein
MGRAWAGYFAPQGAFTGGHLVMLRAQGGLPTPGLAYARLPEEGSMQDLLYIALTIIAFGVLWLLVKGVEHFER